MGLRVYFLKVERARILMDVLIQPHMVKANVERGLWGAIHAIVRKEMPHLAKHSRRAPGPPLGFFSGSL